MLSAVATFRSSFQQKTKLEPSYKPLKSRAFKIISSLRFIIFIFAVFATSNFNFIFVFIFVALLFLLLILILQAAYQN